DVGSVRGAETRRGDVHRMGPLRAWLADRVGVEAIAVGHCLRWRGRSAPIRGADGASSEPPRSRGRSPGGDYWRRGCAEVERTRDVPRMTTRAGVSQSETDTRNVAFWNELCGSGLARSIGINKRTPESLRKFDEAYMTMYPYLARYVTAENLPGKKTLEIGLGY